MIPARKIVTIRLIFVSGGNDDRSLDYDLTVVLYRQDRDTALPLVRFGYLGLIGQESFRHLFGQIDQRVVSLAVCRFAGREVEDDRSASGISQTVNFTGEPALRAAKSSLMGPLFRRLPTRVREP